MVIWVELIVAFDYRSNVVHAIGLSGIQARPGARHALGDGGHQPGLSAPQVAQRRPGRLDGAARAPATADGRARSR